MRQGGRGWSAEACGQQQQNRGNTAQSSQHQGRRRGGPGFGETVLQLPERRSSGTAEYNASPTRCG